MSEKSQNGGVLSVDVQVQAKVKQLAELLSQQQYGLDGPHPCPQCGSQCSPDGQTERELLTRLGPVRLSGIKFHCNACRRSFFPQRESLGLDGRKYDSQSTELIVLAGSRCKSFSIAADLVKSFLGLQVLPSGFLF